MALEGGDRGFGPGVIKTGDIEAVAVAEEHPLQGLDFGAFGAGLHPRAVLEVPLTEAIIEMASAGMGIGFLARWAVAPKLRSGDLVARPLSKTGYQRHWEAATLQKHQVPDHVSQFLKLLKQTITSKRIQKLN